MHVLTADDQILEHTVTCKPVRRTCVTHLVDVVELYPDTVDKFLRLLDRDLPCVDILFVLRIHILVETTGGNGMSARFDLQ